MNSVTPNSDVPGAKPPAEIQLSEKFAPVKNLYESICDEVGKLFVGQDELVLGTLTALFSGGHVPVSYTHLTLPTIYSV